MYCVVWTAQWVLKFDRCINSSKQGLSCSVTQSFSSDALRLVISSACDSASLGSRSTALCMHRCCIVNAAVMHPVLPGSILLQLVLLTAPESAALIFPPCDLSEIRDGRCTVVVRLLVTHTLQMRHSEGSNGPADKQELESRAQARGPAFNQ